MTLQTMYPGMVNSPQTELAADITADDTTIPLLDASVLPAAPNLATIGTGEDAETVLYTGKSGNNLTGVTRGFQGVAKAWNTGTKVARNFTAYDYDALRENLEDHAAATTDVHGATSAATPNRIVQRDSAGRFKAAAPSDPDDVARKAEVDAVQTNLNNHANATTGVHGATSAATPNTIVQRDSAGRAKVAAPAAADDIANKSYVDNAVANLGNIDQRLAFTAGIQDGDANDDVSLIKSVQHHTHTRSVVLIYSNGRLSSVEERNGSDTVKSTVLNYDSNGRLSSIVEVAGGVTVTQTLNYDGSGNLTSVTRAVS